nr:uncharacterized protein LOC112937337 [Oryza sativa Japonica Group]
MKRKATTAASADPAQGGSEAEKRQKMENEIKTLQVVKFSGVYYTLPLHLVAPAVQHVLGRKTTILRMRGATLDENNMLHLEIEFLSRHAAMKAMEHCNDIDPRHKRYIQVKWNDTNLDVSANNEEPVLQELSYLEPQPDSTEEKKVTSTIFQGFNRYLPWQ